MSSRQESHMTRVEAQQRASRSRHLRGIYQQASHLFEFDGMTTVRNEVDKALEEIGCEPETTRRTRHQLWFDAHADDRSATYWDGLAEADKEVARTYFEAWCKTRGI